MRRMIIMALAALAGGFYLGTPAPTEAADVTPVPAALSISWGAPTVLPANKRTIEVVDQLKPSKWHVSAAAEWLDHYTASNMKTVTRCSGHAWKCVYLRGGKLPGNVLAWTQGNRITVDTGKVDRHGYRSDFRRKEIMVHELAHSFGIVKHTNYTVMAASMTRTRFYLNGTQRAFLRTR